MIRPLKGWLNRHLVEFRHAGPESLYLPRPGWQKAIGLAALLALQVSVVALGCAVWSVIDPGFPLDPGIPIPLGAALVSAVVLWRFRSQKR